MQSDTPLVQLQLLLAGMDIQMSAQTKTEQTRTTLNPKTGNPVHTSVQLAWLQHEA